MIPSYPKVWNLGHPNIKDLLLDDVLVEEKVDGSQFSFGIWNGELICRSKTQAVFNDKTGMFKEACAVIEQIAERGLLANNVVYRAEYLRKPRHNGLSYSRIPNNHLALFDVEVGPWKYMGPDGKANEAERLGIECVPSIHFGAHPTMEMLNAFLERESFLGGAKIEGVVIKNYNRFGQDGHALMGKFVSEVFKEEQRKSWKTDNPKRHEVLEVVSEKFRTEARWRKAMERLRDRGELQDSVRDIGNLLSEIKSDVAVEAEAPIKEELWSWAKPHVLRKSTAGFPEWYKKLLMAKQFAGTETKDSADSEAGGPAPDSEPTPG